MQLTCVLSSAKETDRALAELCAAVKTRLRGARPDLLLVFISPHHLPDAEAAAAISATLREDFPTALLLGASAAGVIGDALEAEDRPAISLTAAVLPGVELRAFHLLPTDVPLYAGPESATRWRNLLLPEEADAEGDALTAPPPARPADPTAPPEDPTILLLPDPFCPDLPDLLAGLDAAWPRGQVVGGLVSGFRGRGQHRLLLDDEVHDRGVLGLVLYGDVEAEVRVAQGCRPVGQPLFVTAHDGQRLVGLDGRPAVDVLQETYESADDAERERMRQSLFIGLGLVGRDSYGRGDFLVRNILGAEPETGAIVVQGDPSESQVVQFHVRDAESSADDLGRHLASVPKGAAGALMFSCVGRGQALYGVANHDAELLQRTLGPLPVGGFFCNGEIGAVNGRTFLHGYTSSLVFLRPKTP